MHRYTFLADKPAHVLIDLRSSIYSWPGKIWWSRLRMHADGTVTGFRETRGWAPGRQPYFAMRFSAPVTNLYDYAGVPWKTQSRLRQIMDSQYAPTPDGLVGNDDCGQMSAWFIFTAPEFYPVAPASNEYVIGRPFVSRATLKLPDGRRFTIIADNLSDANPYVGAVTLDDKPLMRSYITQQEIMKGGELRFIMQTQPNTDWATRAEDRPFSMSAYK